MHIITALLLIVLITASSFAQSIPMQVAQHQGKTGYFAPGSTTWNPVVSNQAIEPAGAIKTWADAHVAVSLDVHGGARVANKSKVRFDRAEVAGKKRLGAFTVEEGNLLLSLNSADHLSTDFRIRTPTGTAGARGTTYRAGVHGITVLHGTVRVAREGRRTGLLPSGYTMRPDGSVVLDKSLLREALAEFESLHRAAPVDAENYRAVRRSAQIALLYADF